MASHLVGNLNKIVFILFVVALILSIIRLYGGTHTRKRPLNSQVKTVTEEKSFKGFLKEFGQPTSTRKAQPAEIERYRGKLPDMMLEFWKIHGFCGFRNGLLWIVNPKEYEDLLDEWIGDTPIVKEDTYHIIARNAFGDFYLWGEKNGCEYILHGSTGRIIKIRDAAGAISGEKADYALQSFFSILSPDNVDTQDENHRPLFERALKKCGPPGPDEIYGFEPTLVAGGTKNIEHLAKLNLHIHLSIILQFSHRELLDMSQ